MAVQASYLKQVKQMAAPLGLPILCAGDIFDRWNAPPELINFALRELPDGMICVPGQHDLPNHRIDQIDRCGYGVLKQTGKIIDIAGRVHVTHDLFIRGFGWGQEIKPIKDDDEVNDEGGPSIALIHRYCWDIEHSYPGAPKENHVGEFMKRLKGYDIACFGDNHKGFLRVLKTGTTVLNVGGFIRRKSDEITYHPAVGIIFDDGTVKHKKLTLLDDFHVGVEDREEVPLNMEEFIQGLEALGEHGLNFREAVENHLRNEEIDKETKEIILRALDNTTT